MMLVENSINPLSVQSDKILSGIFAEIDTFNQNGRRYPEAIYMQAYDEVLPKIQERRLLGELDHPLEYDEVRLSNVSHVIIESHIEEIEGHKRVLGSIELLDTPAGLIAQALVKAGINLGISSRGLGATKQVREGSDVTSFNLITYDLVADPSFSIAVLTPEKSQELTDSLNYIESNLPLNESLEGNSIRKTITRIRESLTAKETNLSEGVDIQNQVEIDRLKGLLESTEATIKSDTELLIESRNEIKRLRQEVQSATEKHEALLENMTKLQDAYNELHESSTIKDSKIEELNESLISLRKSLAVEKRGMSYDRVSELLEGATTESEIESRLNSLSSISRKRQDNILSESITQTKRNTQTRKLKGLAQIVSRV